VEQAKLSEIAENYEAFRVLAEVKNCYPHNPLSQRESVH